MMTLAISRPHWLLIAISRSVRPDQLFPAADLGDRRAQLMIGLEPVLRTMDIALQLRVSEVIERVDAADQLVELEDRLSRRVMLRQGAQFADQRALAGFLKSKGGDDPVDIGFSAAIAWRSICPAG